jgi:predicted MPP superfamily phosphohydrolase
MCSLFKACLMVSIVSLLLHLYVGARLLPALAAWPVMFCLLLAALAASAWLMPMGVGLGARLAANRKQNTATHMVWLGWTIMGLFSSLFVLTLLRDAVLLAYLIANSMTHDRFMLPSLSAYSALDIELLAVGVTVLGLINARRTASVVSVDVPIQGLPPALSGFRIAQISDIHVGPTIKKEYLQRIVAAVNKLQADMVAITGDLVDGSVQDLAPHVAPLAELSSRHGTFFVTGNHEYYSGAHAWIAELQRLGVKVLLNTHMVLNHSNLHTDAPARMVVAGVTDYSAGHFDPAHRSDPVRAIAGAPQAASVRILLAHQPRSAPAAAETGFDLQLSGHTHGGQFLPWNFFVRLQQPFVAGLHRLHNLWVYTSRGTGYWGPPKRFGAPAEITLLRLVPA